MLLHFAEISILKNEFGAENHFISPILKTFFKDGNSISFYYNYYLSICLIIQAFERLQKLGLTMSHRSLSRLLTVLGKDHDKKVLEWKECLQNEVVLEVSLFNAYCMC